MGNNKYKVLIVEDDQSILGFVQTILETNGYQVLTAERCRQGLLIFSSYTPDLVVLDLGLPDMDGGEFIRQVRLFSTVPIIVLSARTEENDKVSALDLGANDYITKPFSMRELIARVGANIRRTAMNTAAAATAAATAMPVAGDLSIDTDSHQVFRDGKPLELTTREYELLTFLASHPNKVYSRIDLMEQVWNYGYVGDDQRTVDVTVRRLREKIEETPASPKYILTRRGVGYYFAV